MKYKNLRDKKHDRYVKRVAKWNDMLGEMEAKAWRKFRKKMKNYMKLINE